MSKHDERVVARTTLEHWFNCHVHALTKDERAAIEGVFTVLPDQPLSREVKRQRSYALTDEEWRKKYRRRDS